MTDKNTLKSWFQTNLKPTQAQFWAWIDSFYHKDEMIPITAIDELENILNEKANTEALTNHVGDANAHAELFAEPNARLDDLEAKTDAENNWKTITGYSLNPATRVLTMDAGWEGIINGIDYTNAAAVPLPAITLAAAGYSRIDLIVFNTAGTFVIVPGIETVNTPVKPAKLTNTLEATFVTVSDGVVNVPVIPKPKAPVTSVNGMRGDVVLNAINDLVTGGIYDFLSAEQGKVLKTQIDNINILLASDNVNMDNVQEIVDAIETVQTSLSTILVNDLTTGGTTKALTAEMGKNLKGLVDALTTTVNGKISTIVTTVKTITSASLSTQDAAGFVAYINALGVVLVVAANETVEYQLSDTGRIFRLLLNGRSFGTGQPAITTANVEDVTLWMQKDLKLSNYPSTRNDGALPTNKVLAPDTNGNLKLYSTPILPAPYLHDLIPDSYLPSTTGNFILKGAFFTPTMTVAVTGQTVNYVTFISDNEVRANITTGAAEGTFAVILNNGLSATFNNRMLITLGTVYKPAPADWINVSSQINIDTEGEGHIGVFNAANLAEWNKQFDYTKNWSIRLTIVVSPLGTPSTFNFDNNTAGVFIRKVSDNANVFNFTRQGTLADRILECANLGNKLFTFTLNSVLEIRYVGGVIYFYSDNVLKFTSAVSITENLKLALVLNTYDVVGIKYIELA